MRTSLIYYMLFTTALFFSSGAQARTDGRTCKDHFLNQGLYSYEQDPFLLGKIQGELPGFQTISFKQLKQESSDHSSVNGYLQNLKRVVQDCHAKCQGVPFNMDVYNRLKLDKAPGSEPEQNQKYFICSDPSKPKIDINNSNLDDLRYWLAALEDSDSIEDTDQNALDRLAEEDFRTIPSDTETQTLANNPMPRKDSTPPADKANHQKHDDSYVNEFNSPVGPDVVW